MSCGEHVCESGSEPEMVRWRPVNHICEDIIARTASCMVPKNKDDILESRRFYFDLSLLGNALESGARIWTIGKFVAPSFHPLRR